MMKYSKELKIPQTKTIPTDNNLLLCTPKTFRQK